MTPLRLPVYTVSPTRQPQWLVARMPHHSPLKGVPYD